MCALAKDREFQQIAECALERLMPSGDADQRWTISSIEELDIPEPETGHARTLIVIRVDGPNRQTILGQFPPFDAHQLRGYHENYIFGYIHGWFAGKHGQHIWNEYELVVDVESSGRFAKPATVIQRWVPLKQALRDGKILEGSPLHRAMERNSLMYLLYAGKWPSGPSTAMIHAVEKIVAAHRPRVVLDLFAGTCALAAVALRNGAQTATCVDPHGDEKIMLETLGEASARCHFLKQDLTGTIPGRWFDLIIMDPYYDSALTALRDLLPRIRGRYKYLLINLGPKEPQAWHNMLIDALSCENVLIEMTDHHGEITALCTATDCSGSQFM